MSKLESFFIWAIIGPVLPLFLFLAGWWSSLLFVKEEVVFVYGLIGLGLGCIIDIILRRQIKRAYWWKQGVLVLIYLFYSIGFFGFFMGVPIFNLAVGALAGVFMGRRFSHCGVTRVQLQEASTSFAFFTAAKMVLVSMAAAYFATKDLRDTALNLRSMLKLEFVPTNQAIIALIVAGGTGLVLTQYWIAKKLTHWAYRLGKSRV